MFGGGHTTHATGQGRAGAKAKEGWKVRFVELIWWNWKYEQVGMGVYLIGEMYSISCMAVVV